MLAYNPSRGVYHDIIVWQFTEHSSKYPSGLNKLGFQIDACQCLRLACGKCILRVRNRSKDGPLLPDGGVRMMAWARAVWTVFSAILIRSLPCSDRMINWASASWQETSRVWIISSFFFIDYQEREYRVLIIRM